VGALVYGLGADEPWPGDTTVAQRKIQSVFLFRSISVSAKVGSGVDAASACALDHETWT
jgi:hypothetical protein